MTTDQIKAWLKDLRKDRQWLSQQLKATKGTVDQWFSRGFPPGPLAMIKLLMQKQESTSGLDVQFSPSEWSEIEQAMTNAGYSEQRKFFKDGIMSYAESINERPKNVEPLPSPEPEMLRVAEDSPSYRTNAPGL
jgi:hypothetical protein